MLLLIVIIFVATAVQLKGLYYHDEALIAERDRVVKKVDGLLSENVELEATIAYLGDPQNLAKAARKELHYGEPGERLIVVIPKKNP